jgi:hypothetical protein
MVGSKSRQDTPGFDTYSCLKCETVITYAPSPRKPKPTPQT